MTKQEFFAQLAALYQVGNRADSTEAKAEAGETWTKWQMAGTAFCAKIDDVIREMVKVGVLTEDEAANWLESVDA
ncbi:hypothetical protein [Paraburkholderia sp. GAS32]|uniref:hypothetical protein n=1 Tax=Paraburkholderia sp. GAS32 TaxID=3035129 RepID=UPI003D1E9378